MANRCKVIFVGRFFMVLPGFGRRTRGKHASQTERNLYVAIRDGMAYATMVGLGETYFGAFAVYLQASALQIGILASLPPLFGALCQIFSLRLLELIKSRRWLVVAGARLQASSLLPMIAIPLLFGTGPVAATVLIVLVMAYQAGLGLLLPVWNSLIGDLCPPSLRGRYFGRRNQLAGVCTLTAVLIAGEILHLFTASNFTAVGYACIFTVAALARYRSSVWLSRYDDPDYHFSDESYFSLAQFILRTPQSNFARFVFFVSLMMFATNVAAPYFAIYMLNDLGFSYFQYMVLTSVVIVTQILTLGNWGRIADRFGSKKILAFCGYGAALNPLFWLFSSNIYFLIFVQLYSGFVWAGFNLAASTFMFDAVSPQKRARCAAYQATVQGVLVLAGTLLGARLLDIIPTTFSFYYWQWTPASPLLVVFLVSGLLRMFVVRLFLNRFQEVRDVQPTKHYKLIFYVLNGVSESSGTIDVLAPATTPNRQAVKEAADNPATSGAAVTAPAAADSAGKPIDPEQLH